MSQAQIEQYYIPLLHRLAHGEWFTSRTSSCALFPPIYDKVSSPLQDELRRSFAALGTDDTPMVRRAAAKWLGVCPHFFSHMTRVALLTLNICDNKALVKKFAKTHVLGDGLAIYRRLQQDDQDSVRLLTVEDLIAIAQSFSPAEVKDNLLKQIRQTVGDKSWRVRYMSASHFNEVGGLKSHTCYHH